jgi:F-type H+-transporting ATPase subunit a
VSGLASLIVRSDGFTPPGPGDFNLPPIGSGEAWSFFGQPMFWGVTKPMVLALAAMIVVLVFFRAATAKKAMVPGKLQFMGEASYNFVRNTLGRDVIGSHDFMRFVPVLAAFFFFIVVNNYFGVLPFLQFPTMSRIGYPMGLALVAWLIYNGVGIQKHGFFGYLKLQTVPSGVPAAMLVLLIPLEFLSNIIVRPITLMLRLFANMFAGHLLLLLFALGGEFLLLHGHGLIAKPGGVVALIMFFVISALELLVHFLQAFIFTILTALYISSAVADEH